MSIDSKKASVLIGRIIFSSVDQLTVDVDVVNLRAQADASMPASNNNVIIIQYI